MEETETYQRQHSHDFHRQQTTTAPPTPQGLEAIYNSCKELYPDQPNPLQVTALVKYWLGGPDPLDYISMYMHPGDRRRNVPPHWHYVTMGLSDLHGDGRVHELSNNDGPSGFGFELTFRLRREPTESAPPTWPAALMQALARYVFQTDNTLCSGDHVPWHSPLDGSESRVQHMLMTGDPQMPTVTSPFGTVNFVQIVGVTTEELRAAQHWNGIGVLDLLKQSSVAGGPWLVTDMRRGETVFELDPHFQERVDQGIEMEGSNLSGVSSRCHWEELSAQDLHTWGSDEDDKENRWGRGKGKAQISEYESDQIKSTLRKGLTGSKGGSKEHERRPGRKASFDSNTSSEAPSELMRTQTLDAVHLHFNAEAGALLPLALRGRLKHGRHFTFKSVTSESAITLVSPSVVGSFTDEEHPYAAHGPWLQVLLTEEFVEPMLTELQVLQNMEELTLPKTFRWPEKKLFLTIIPEEV